MKSPAKRDCSKYSGWHSDVFVVCVLQTHPLKVQSAPKIFNQHLPQFFCPATIKFRHYKFVMRLHEMLTQHDRHSRKRRRQYCRSSKPKIRFITLCSGVSITSAFSNSIWMVKIASRSKSASCRLMWIFSMFEKNFRFRTNKPASAVKKLFCQIQ